MASLTEPTVVALPDPRLLVVTEPTVVALPDPRLLAGSDPNHTESIPRLDPRVDPPLAAPPRRRPAKPRLESDGARTEPFSTVTEPNAATFAARAGKGKKPSRERAATGTVSLGKYQLLRPLASGATSHTFLARQDSDAGSARHLAVKTLRRQHVYDTAHVTAFHDEARLLMALHHRNLAQVFDVALSSDGTHYLAMEYLHGETLAAMVQRARTKGAGIPMDFALTAISAAASALHHVHERHGNDPRWQNLPVREITPASITAVYDGLVKLTSFGSSKASVRAALAGDAKARHGYLTPEHALGKPLDARSDVFALGVALYELTTLVSPFAARSPQEQKARVTRGEPTAPSQLVPGYPAELELVVMTALNKSPDHRYQTCAALSDALVDVGSVFGLTIGPNAIRQALAQLFGGKIEPWLEPASETPMPVTTVFGDAYPGALADDEPDDAATAPRRPQRSTPSGPVAAHAVMRASPVAATQPSPIVGAPTAPLPPSPSTRLAASSAAPPSVPARLAAPPMPPPPAEARAADGPAPAAAAPPPAPPARSKAPSQVPFPPRSKAPSQVPFPPRAKAPSSIPLPPLAMARPVAPASIPLPTAAPAATIRDLPSAASGVPAALPSAPSTRLAVPEAPMAQLSSAAHLRAAAVMPPFPAPRPQASAPPPVQAMPPPAPPAAEARTARQAVREARDARESEDARDVKDAASLAAEPAPSSMPTLRGHEGSRARVSARPARSELISTDEIHRIVDNASAWSESPSRALQMPKVAATPQPHSAAVPARPGAPFEARVGKSPRRSGLVTSGPEAAASWAGLAAPAATTSAVSTPLPPPEAAELDEPRTGALRRVLETITVLAALFLLVLGRPELSMISETLDLWLEMPAPAPTAPTAPTTRPVTTATPVSATPASATPVSATASPSATPATNPPTSPTAGAAVAPAHLPPAGAAPTTAPTTAGATATASTTVPPAATTGLFKIVITSEPAGATVLLDGERLGRTPITAERPLGEGVAVLRLRHRGYQPRKIEIKRSEDVTLKVKLRPEVAVEEDAGEAPPPAAPAP